MTKPTTHLEAIHQIANLGTCGNGKTPTHKLFQQALDIAVAAIDIPVYKNPLPVAVYLQKVMGPDKRVGVLLIKRGDNKGWAFPSGWVETSDLSAEHAASREFAEETNIIGNLGTLFWSQIIPGDKIMVFVKSPDALWHEDATDIFQPNREALEMRIAYEPEELVFPTHTKAMRLWFEQHA